MTEAELNLVIKYHGHMRDHHLTMIKHYQKRRNALRKAVAEKQSEKITNDILDKLKTK